MAIAAAMAFGGVDQYIGGRYSSFATTISLLSAPWLLVPFAAGASQARTRQAAVLGVLATMAALAGYILMTVSPMEGVHMDVHSLVESIRAQHLYVLGGLVTGPVYGALGQRWRARRSLLSAVLAVSTLLLEPFAGALGMTLDNNAAAYLAESATGVVLAGFFAVVVLRSRRGSPGTSQP